MTDFLKNLIGRSRGTIEVAQPRIPSLFEPYRRGEGLLGSVPGLAGSRADAASPAPPGADSGADRTPLPPRTPTFRTSPLSPDALEGPTSADESEPSRPVMSANLEGTPWPSLAPHRLERPAPPGQNQGSTTDAEISPVQSAAPGPSPESSAPARSAWNRVVLPGVDPSPQNLTGSLESRPSPPPRATPGGLGQIEHAQNVTPGASPSLLPSLLALQASPLRAAVRPPIAPRAGGPDRVAVSAPAPPSVQVSIGRVEVRAVFPEPAARRAPLPKSKPMIPLGEYLNQRQRGKR